MEIYLKNNEGVLQETTIMEVLKIALKKAKIKMDNGRLSDDSSQWVGIVQESKAPSEVTINLAFEEDGNSIMDVRVYESPIKRVVDEDNSRCIV